LSCKAGREVSRSGRDLEIINQIFVNPQYFQLNGRGHDRVTIDEHSIVGF
jgi:hypothetical protein